MTREKFLTVRWNILLTLGLGIPGLVFVVSAFSNSTWTSKSGMIWLSVIGGVY